MKPTDQPGRPTRLVDRAARAEADIVHTDVLLPFGSPSPVVLAAGPVARGSVLWLVIAAGLALRPGAARRAAGRGVLAVAVTTTAAHLLGRLVPRHRPRVGDMPARTALHEHPTSSAFPSAHAASAAAFATAAALESPPLGAALAPVAAVVAYSRVRTRVHWPTDVVAGALLGATTAVLTRRRGPRRA
ncbi:phosphatase PAP2 family protein [Saccharothrix sp. Mg75]|uniref:phosphatase PAP2 family protein n=1 Tax=Saccharothrix sp. Mg75 TaxID=3445357 RepID=UPI003EECE298